MHPTAPQHCAFPPGAGRQPIDDWHVCISGFRQSTGDPSGIQTVWSRLRKAHDNCRVAVEYWEWSAAWDQVAEFFWNFRRPGETPRVYIYAYSWGAGYGFVRLATELAKRGIEVPHAVLCDPVYRSPIWAVAKLAAFLPWHRVRVPANVRRVTRFFQRVDALRGHQLLVDDPARTQVDEQELHVLHRYMDDHEDFQAACVRVAEESRA